MSVCDVDLATCRDSLVMTEDKGWLELDKAPIFTRDGRQFAMPLSADNRTQVNVVLKKNNKNEMLDVYNILSRKYKSCLFFQKLFFFLYFGLKCMKSLDCL